MYKSYSMELAGRTLTVDIGRVCAQANGAALLKYGETTVLSTATASDKPRDGVDFFPLSVEFEEKMYSVGKIPGGFNKREGKASENSILTARVIDRPMRPLFPKDYRNDVTLNNMVMSVDPECRPELVAMIGAALSTTISDIPFDGPCAMTQMGMKNGEFIVNPSQKDWDEGDLKLTVASTATKVIMIEAGANEIPEAKMIEAIYMAHDINQTIIEFIDKIVAEVGKEKHTYVSCAVPAEMFEAMKQIVTPQEMEEAVFTDDKQTREKNIDAVTEKMKEAFADNEEWLAVLGEAVYQYQKKTVRKMILKDHKRPDGRAINQIRPLAAEVDMLERLKAFLEEGHLAKNFELQSEEEEEWFKEYNLLTAKPVIYAANVAEDDLADDGATNEHVAKVRQFAADENSEVFVICAQIEQEIAELDDEEKKMFLEDLGIAESGLEKLIKASYKLLGLISYITSGEMETKAWTITKGTKAPQAAGKIHTDFERGFIKAEVVNYQDLLDNGSLAAAREKGIVGMEGKDYVVKDGDVILFRFNV